MADSLGFRLSLDSKEFEIKIDNAGRLLNRLSNQGTKASTGVKRLEGGFRGFNRTLSDTINASGMTSFAIGTLKTALFDWQKTILDSAGKLERLQVMLQGLATSSDKAAESMRDFNFIVDKAKNAPFSIDAVSDSFVKLKTAGIDPTKGGLDAMIDSVARFGGDSELLKRATIAIQQMSGKGVVSMEELRQQLGEAIPSAMNLMAASMNMTVGELTKAVSTGTVEANSAIKGMFAMMEVSYGGSAERMMNTYTGLVSQVKTNAALLAKSIGDAGYMDAVKDALRDINALLMSDSASYYGKQFGSMAKEVIDAVKEMMVWVVNNKSVLTSLLQVLLAIGGAKIFLSFMKTAIGSLTSFNRSITTVISGGVSFGQHILNVAERSRRMGGSLNIATIAIGQMTHAWRGLNMAMNANVIVAAITIVIEAVIALAWWFGEVEKKAKDAYEAARNTPDMTTDEQFNLVKEKALDEEKALDVSNKKLKMLMNQRKSILRAKNSGHYYDKGKLKEVNEAIKAAEEGQKKASKRYQETLNTINSVKMSRAREATRKEIEAIKKDNLTKIEQSRDDFQIQMKQLDDEQKSRLEKAKNNSEEQAKIKEEIGNKKRELYIKQTEEEKAGLEKIRDVLIEKSKEIKNTIEKKSTDINGAANSANKSFLDILGVQKAELGKQLNDIVAEIENKNDDVKNAVNLFKSGFEGIDGTFHSGSKDEIGKQLKTLAQNENRMSLGDRINNGEQIKTIDGRIARSRQEAEASQRVVEILEKQGIKVNDLTSAYKELSQENKKSVDETMKAARIQGEADRKRQANQGESKEAKAKRLAEKMAAENKKILDQAESMAAKVSFGSSAVVNYDKDIKALTESLNKLKSSNPEEGILTQEQIDKAKKGLEEITAAVGDYRNALAKDSADQLISKWAGFANTVKSNMTQSVAEMRSEFEKNYQEADDYFDKIIKANEKNTEVYEYLKAEQAKFHAGKEEAMVRMTETATAKMAYDYQNLGKLIDDNMKNVFDNLEDRLMDFLETGKFDIADFGNFIFKELQRSFIRSMVISPMINGMGLGAGGETGGSLLSTVGSAIGSIGSMFSGSGSTNATGGTDGITNPAQSPGENAASKSTEELGKAATETTGALQTMQSQGIFTTVAGYAQQLWAMITGTTAQAANTTATTASSSANSALAGSAGIATAALYELALAATTAAMKQAGSAAFANGGIMSSSGAIPLKAYSKGGIATSPQLALFGEGAQNEAYVPLPDGRSIPVSMNIAGGEIGEEERSDKNVVISISVVNQGNDKNEKSNLSDESAWNEMAQKIKTIVIETVSEEKRPGGMLTE